MSFHEKSFIIINVSIIPILLQPDFFARDSDEPGSASATQGGNVTYDLRNSERNKKQTGRTACERHWPVQWAPDSLPIGEKSLANSAQSTLVTIILNTYSLLLKSQLLLLSLFNHQCLSGDYGW